MVIQVEWEVLLPRLEGLGLQVQVQWEEWLPILMDLEKVIIITYRAILHI